MLSFGIHILFIADDNLVVSQLKLTASSRHQMYKLTDYNTKAKQSLEDDIKIRRVRWFIDVFTKAYNRPPYSAT
jgi:hypothetical protein